MVKSKAILTAVVVAFAISASPLASRMSAKQGAPGRQRGVPAPGPLAEGGGVSPAEIQRLFDAYVVMQAQQELQLTDDQFSQFLARVRTLQDVRRRGQMQRGRMLMELRRLSQLSGQDEPLRGQLKALADLDLRVSSETKQAMDAVDQVLDLRQQARFRIFEEQMERRKVELLMRARQANRPRQQN